MAKPSTTSSSEVTQRPTSTPKGFDLSVDHEYKSLSVPQLVTRPFDAMKRATYHSERLIRSTAGSRLDNSLSPDGLLHPAILRYRQAHPSRSLVNFGPYTLLQTLGEGEFGKVKLGVHGTSGEEVAVKLIRRQSIVECTRLTKVEREIEVLKAVQHPNIVRLSDVIETEKYIGIILDFANGGELFDYILAHRYLKEREAAKLFAQLISGVHYLHSKRIIHRDLKLENLLLDKDRNIIITDFGFANRFDHKRDDLMATSCGSPCYAAPELVISDGLYVGAAVDVWSCGVILYAMLSGYLPFDDDPANPDGDNINLLYRYIVNTPLTFPEYLSASARDLLQSMLVPDPANRCGLVSVMSHPWLKDHRAIFDLTLLELENVALSRSREKKRSSRKDTQERTVRHERHMLRCLESQVSDVCNAQSKIDTGPMVSGIQQCIPQILAGPTGTMGDTQVEHSVEAARSSIPDGIPAREQAHDSRPPERCETAQRQVTTTGGTASPAEPSSQFPACASELSGNVEKDILSGPAVARQYHRHTIQLEYSHLSVMDPSSPRTLAALPDWLPHSDTATQNASPSELIPSNLPLNGCDALSCEKEGTPLTSAARLVPNVPHEESTQTKRTIEGSSNLLQTNASPANGPPFELSKPLSKEMNKSSKLGVSTRAAKKVMDWFRRKSQKSIEHGLPIMGNDQRSDQVDGSLHITSNQGQPRSLLLPTHSKKEASPRIDRNQGSREADLSHDNNLSPNGKALLVNETTGSDSGKLRYHTGVLDQAALSSSSPHHIMGQLYTVLRALGIEVKRESLYRLRAVRPGPDPRAELGLREYPNNTGQDPLSVSGSIRDIFARRSSPVPLGGASFERTRSALQMFHTLNRDLALDVSDEIRFTIELTKLRNLPGLYSVDIKRLRGNAWAFKSLYDTILERCELSH